MLQKQDILELLRKFKKNKGATYDIIRLGIFGSAARGTAHEDSDIDVVVVLGKPDMFNLIGIKQDLEDEFKCKIDLVRHRENMNPFLKKRIDKEAVYV
ncbi:MAG: nucleotidyltransferase [Desulfatiglans sp.]|jgi:predicted nucleotidyltransferase|nr:nucleotidyltransferase [Desulfatiglans sp.]